MSKEKSLEEEFEEFNKNYNHEETKAFVKQAEEDSRKLDKIFVTKPADQSHNDNVQKMGHTQEKHCDIL